MQSTGERQVEVRTYAKFFMDEKGARCALFDSVALYGR